LHVTYSCFLKSVAANIVKSEWVKLKNRDDPGGWGVIFS